MLLVGDSTSVQALSSESSSGSHSIRSFSRAFDFGFVVACDLPFGEVVEGFSRVQQNWTMIQQKARPWY